MGQNAPQPMGATSADADANPMLKLLKGGTQGLAKGFSDMQNQNAMMRQGGGSQMGPMPQAQPVDPSYFSPQTAQQNNPFKPLRGNNLSFYGDANG